MSSPAGRRSRAAPNGVGRQADRIRPYLELLRPPNVVTAAADVLAGYAIAGHGNPRALPWLLASTVCLYGGGVVLNDVFDRDIDRVERPERPIPSGRATTGAAAALGAALLAAGTACAARATPAAGAIALLLTACILAYDGWTKRHAAGPLNMGVCRALNLLLGVAAVSPALAARWPLALLPLVHVTAVTLISRGEVHGGRRNVAAIVLGMLTGVVAAAIVIAGAARPPSLAGLAFAVALGWFVLPRFWSAFVTPDAASIRRAVRTGVLALVLLDAVLGAVYAGVLYGATIAATAVLAAVLARLFPVT